MTARVDVVVPTCWTPAAVPLLEAALADYADDPAVDEVVVVDNSGGYAPPRGFDAHGALIFHAPRRGIYATWNAAAQRAARRGRGLLVVNDDVAWTCQPATPAVEYAAVWDLAVVGTAPGPYTGGPPLLVRGTHRHGGIGGHAFYVAPGWWRDVDERYEWWGGDDDLMFRVERDGGLLARLPGWWCEHTPETSASVAEWTGPAKDRDRERLREAWGDTW